MSAADEWKRASRDCVHIWGESPLVDEAAALVAALEAA